MRSAIIIAALLLAGKAYSQDRVQTRSGQMIQGKILSMDQVEMRLRNQGNQDTTISNLDVSYVKHQNGMRDRISLNGIVHRRFAPKFQFPSDEPKFYRKNYFHIGVGNLLFGQLSMGFERIIDGGKIGIKLPVKFYFVDDYGMDNQNVLDSYGLDINFYPGRQGTFRFFTGLGFRTGAYGRQYEEGGYSDWYGYHHGASKQVETTYRAMMLNAGIFIRPFTWLGFNVVAGLGAGRIKGIEQDGPPDEYRQSERFVMPDLQVNLTIGI